MPSSSPGHGPFFASAFVQSLDGAAEYLLEQTQTIAGAIVARVVGNLRQRLDRLEAGRGCCGDARGPARWISSVSSLMCIMKSGVIGCGRPSWIARTISAIPRNLSCAWFSRRRIQLTSLCLSERRRGRRRTSPKLRPCLKCPSETASLAEHSGRNIREMVKDATSQTRCFSQVNRDHEVIRTPFQVPSIGDFAFCVKGKADALL